MKLAFVKIRDDLTSIKIRSDQMAQALNTVSLMSDDEQISDFDIIIYVKYPDSLENMQKRNKNGKIQILDPIDNFHFTEFDKRKDFIDGFIASSVSHKNLLQSKYDIPIQFIPHHHANFSGNRIRVKKDEELVLGYIGDKTHFKKLKFLEKYFDNIYKDINYKSLEQSYLAIDIGCAYRKDKMKMKYNSSLKLLNYMSYGIPSVLNFELGYSEVGNHGEHCFFVDSKKDLISYIRYLMKDYDLRKRMSEAGIIKAKDYHIIKIADRYKRFLNQEFNLKI